MKKLRKLSLIIACFLALNIPAGSLTGCKDKEGDFASSSGGTVTADKGYTIQYTDEEGTHAIEVETGMPYSVEKLPKKVGYEFLGLFDAEVGGTKYVSEKGTSLSPFTDNKNMILFPQYKAKTYGVILDFQGAIVTGSREMTVAYDTKIPELPLGLQKDHMEFVGWFTEPNCQGKKIADKYGTLPVVSVLNQKNFDVEGSDEVIYLYAGFEMETYEVTLHFGENTGIPSEVLAVEYNTPISEIIPEERNNDGFAVSAWSKTSDGSQPFTGKVTGDIVLYASAWAPVITFDVGDGEGINPLVKNAGSAIQLPKAKRDNYQFMGWETTGGASVNYTTMPAESVTLKAVWQAYLVFNENGGTGVEDISQVTGTKVTLPTTEREGYLFAGWYNENGEKYTDSSMPEVSTTLKAGWYKYKTTSKSLISATGWMECNATPSFAKSGSADVSEIVNGNYEGIPVKISGGVKFGHGYASVASPKWAVVEFYSSPTINEGNLLSQYRATVTAGRDANQQFYFKADWILNTDTIYACCYGQVYNTSTYARDVFVDITYPDMSKVY